MPKDATKNVDRYKVRGGKLNEFDFNKNQEEFAEQERKTAKGTRVAKGPKGASKESAARKTAKK